MDGSKQAPVVQAKKSNKNPSPWPKYNGTQHIAAAMFVLPNCSSTMRGNIRHICELIYANFRDGHVLSWSISYDHNLQIVDTQHKRENYPTETNFKMAYAACNGST